MTVLCKHLEPPLFFFYFTFKEPDFDAIFKVALCNSSPDFPGLSKVFFGQWLLLHIFSIQSLYLVFSLFVSKAT